MSSIKKASLPPGPKPLPIVGNLLQFRKDKLGYLEYLQRTYGNIATMYIGNTPIIMLFRPEHVRYILTENPRNFTNREIAENLRELLGDGLLTIDGETHRQQRRLAQPAFHKKRVESYADIMVQHADDMLIKWHPGSTLNMASEMQELTLRIVAHCLLNIDLAQEVDELGYAFSEMIDNPATMIEGILKLHINQPFTAYGRRMAAKKQVDTFIYKLIKQRRAEGRDAGDILSMLLTDQGDAGTLNDTQVHDHIMTFVAAGHETTANALTWTFYLLSQYPQVRKKLSAELHTVLGGRAPTLEDIPRLTYTEWVLNESMRIYPPAWVQGRRAIAAFDLDGYHFPAGTMVMFSQWIIHRLPEIWGDAEVFRPERWNQAEAQQIPAWSYFPFGGGPRMCIGMPFAQLEAKLLLATIFQRCTPLIIPGSKRIELAPLITLRPKEGMPMLLQPPLAL